MISQYVTFVVNNKCGSQAADLVSKYYFHFRGHFFDLLGEIIGATSICDKQGHDNITFGDGFHMGLRKKEGDPLLKLFNQFLQDRSPRTAMDTVYGRGLRNSIKQFSFHEFCNPVAGLSLSFQACALLSYDASNKGIFNVLHYAHSMFLPYTDNPRPSSMGTFSSCWSLLQQICGANATYREYNYLVSTGSRQIHEMMDNLTCKWQDMLIGHYIAATESGNIWPTGYNVPAGPMFLSRGDYTFGDFHNSMGDLSLALAAGIKEISTRCDKPSAKQLRLFYHRLNYFLYDELKLQTMTAMYLYPH